MHIVRVPPTRDVDFHRARVISRALPFLEPVRHEIHPSVMFSQMIAALALMTACAVAIPIFVEGGHRSHASESDENYVSTLYNN